jgi:hypothetical protein
VPCVCVVAHTRKHGDADASASVDETHTHTACLLIYNSPPGPPPPYTQAGRVPVLRCVRDGWRAPHPYSLISSSETADGVRTPRSVISSVMYAGGV